jgi:AcrR family transcriptional regulator
MSRSKSKPGEPGVRERLLDAADHLFYAEGVRAVGIDRVLAEADAAKASLYLHFGCKDELVAAYMARRTAAAQDSITHFMSAIAPEDRAVRFFDWVVAWTDSPEFRGCPMQHVVNEIPDASHPARIAAAAQRDWLMARFTEWVKAAGIDNPKATAGALLVLFDGAIAATVQDGPQRARDARWAAKHLLGR